MALRKSQDPVGPDRSLEQITFHHGRNGPYQWLTVTGDVYMGMLLRLCPEVALHKYIAVTSLDSGIRRISDEESEAGWRSIGDVAYSPRIDSIDTLRFQRDGPQCPGYDEWYVFETPRELGPVFHGNYFDFQPDSGRVLVFVNTFAFVLHDEQPYLPGILDVFWKQLKLIEPETFIADGRDCLTLVTRNELLLENFQSRLLKLS
jgi:hypothetical protein